MTPVDRIGYRVTLVAGDAPGLSTGRTGPVLAETDGLAVFWDGDDDFDFTVQRDRRRRGRQRERTPDRADHQRRWRLQRRPPTRERWLRARRPRARARECEGAAPAAALTNPKLIPAAARKILDPLCRC